MRTDRSAPAILDALGDPVRRLIYERLRRAPSFVGVLAKGLPVTRSAVSRHLAVLKSCGLVDCEVEGSRRLYRVSPRGLAPLSAWIDAQGPSP